VTAVYSFIAEEKAASSCVWSVAEICRTLGVSRQGFYDWQSRPPSDRRVTDRLLAAEIEAIWECSARTYGVPRVHAWLRRQGYRVSRKRVARIMRSHDWVGVCGRRRPRTTIVDKAARAAEDLVARDFNPAGPDVTWAGDITYIPTGEGWLFLATVIDLFSRRVIGWGVADHLRTPLIAAALEMAVATRGGHVHGVVFHSDRGCQGGIRRSSQHLDHGGGAWDDHEAGRQPRPGGQRCVRRAGLRAGGASRCRGFGMRSQRDSRVKTRHWRLGCHPRLVPDGFVRVAGCAPSPATRCRVATSASRSERRSPS
jgi:putative transposase